MTLSQVPIFDDFSDYDTAKVEPKTKSGSWSQVQFSDAEETLLQEGCQVKNIQHNTQDGEKVYFTLF